MKAKEYYKKLEQSDDRRQVFIDNAIDFAREFSDMAHKRNISQSSGIKALFSEFQNKWVVYASLVNTKLYPVNKPVRYDGFKRIIKEISPELHVLLNA